MGKLKKSFNATPPSQDTVDAFCNAACRGKNEIIAEFLKKYGAAIVNRPHKTEGTALKWAAMHGHKNTVALLLDNGADPDATGFNGVTPLIQAVQRNHTEIVQLLLGRGADINKKDDNGTSPLMWAASNGHSRTLRLLLDRGADINARRPDGMTALMCLVGWSRLSMTPDLVESVRLFIKRGAEIGIKNNEGDTALTLAERRSQKQIAEPLQQIVQILRTESAQRQAAEIEKQVRADAGPLKRSIPAPKVIRFPKPKE